MNILSVKLFFVLLLFSFFSPLKDNNSIERNNGNNSVCCKKCDEPIKKNEESDKKVKTIEETEEEYKPSEMEFVLRPKDIPHVVICIYTDDPYFKQSCDIWERSFKDKSLILKIPNEQSISDQNEVTKKISVFLKTQPSELRVTVPIFCHGDENIICSWDFTNFFNSVLKPIREFTEQLLIIDASCFSACHKNKYKDLIGDPPSLRSDPKVAEIYMYGACKMSIARSFSFPGFQNPFVDIILERIAYIDKQNAPTITEFITTVTEVTIFSQLEKIFIQFHNVADGKDTFCCAYHMAFFFSGEKDDIVLSSWFSNYKVIPVVRRPCFFKYHQKSQDSPRKYKKNVCGIVPPKGMMDKAVQKRYFVMDEETFELKEEITLNITTQEDSDTVTETIITSTALIDQKTKKVSNGVEYVVIEIQMSNKKIDLVVDKVDDL